MTHSDQNAETLEELLRAVAAGKLDPADAARQIGGQQQSDLGFARLDIGRMARRGRPEAIFCERKTTAQIVAIARELADAGQNVLLTRIAPEAAEAVRDIFPTGAVKWHPEARIASAIVAPTPQRVGTIPVLCGGTSDLPVAEEAALTAEFYGNRVERHYDVGVAGLHRLLRIRERFEDARAVIVVAGMEGALPSVVAGLCRGAVIAVPASVGYGASFGGFSALLGMLASCSPGIAVVNIDNGFGAGYLADVIANGSEAAPSGNGTPQTG